MIADAAHAYAQQFAMVTGSCIELEVGQENDTAGCKAKLLNVVYPNGVISFWFPLPKPTPDIDALKVDKVTFGAGSGGPTTSQPATGKCTYRPP